MPDFSDILLTVDYDRTLTAPDSTIPARNLEAIGYFMENGGAFTVNTGRSVPMSRAFLDKVPANVPLLLYNGSAAYNRETGMAEADYICMHDEQVDDSKPLEICDPHARWKRKTMENFRAQELQVPVFRDGELVYRLPTLKEIRTTCAYQVSTLWPEVKRFDYPHQYYVDLSPRLMDLKDQMLSDACQKGE